MQAEFPVSGLKNENHCSWDLHMGTPSLGGITFSHIYKAKKLGMLEK